MTLGDILRPTEVETFLHDYLGQRHLVIRGKEGRFSSLASWQTLSDELSRLRVNEQRVQLVKKGVPIPRKEYVYTAKYRGAEYLNGPAVRRHVLNGSTLVVNQIDELLPAVRTSAESCEEIFKVYVTANLYAAWRSDNGFDVHWDRHDTLIVQVVGRKRWKVWQPTRRHPLSGDSLRLVPPPSTDPLWEGALEDGDVLYMPRGWWHVASACEQPSMHLTFVVTHPTGIDVLEWMVGELRENMAVRMDTPLWSEANEQMAWVASLRDACSSILNDNALHRFMASRDAEAHTRPIIDLPYRHEPDVPVLEDDLPFRLVRGRQLYTHRTGETISFQSQGTTWQCDKALAPALALLSHITPCTVSEMAQQIDEQSTHLLRPLLQALLMAHVIWGQPPH